MSLMMTIKITLQQSRNNNVILFMYHSPAHMMQPWRVISPNKRYNLVAADPAADPDMIMFMLMCLQRAREWGHRVDNAVVSR